MILKLTSPSAFAMYLSRMILAAACFVNVSGGSLQRRTRPHLEKISIESAPVKRRRALAAAVQFHDVLAPADSVSHDSKLALAVRPTHPLP